MDNNKLNKKLIIEKPMPEIKKESSPWPLIIFILLLGAAISFYILEKLNYINYLDFI